jgi:hypothetical protein
LQGNLLNVGRGRTDEYPNIVVSSPILLRSKKFLDGYYNWFCFEMITDWLVVITYFDYGYFVVAAFAIIGHYHSTFTAGMFILVMTSQRNGTIYPFTHAIMHFYHEPAGNGNI